MRSFPAPSLDCQSWVTHLSKLVANGSDLHASPSAPQVFFVFMGSGPITVTVGAELLRKFLNGAKIVQGFDDEVCYGMDSPTNPFLANSLQLLSRVAAPGLLDVRFGYLTGVQN